MLRGSKSYTRRDLKIIVDFFLFFFGFEFPTKQKETHSQKELEHEAAAKHLLEELEAKKQELILKENQVKELEQKLQLAEAKSKEKVSFYLKICTRPLIIIMSRKPLHFSKTFSSLFCGTGTTFKAYAYHKDLNISSHVTLVFTSNLNG